MLFFRKSQRFISSLLIILLLSLSVSKLSMAGIVTTAELVSTRQTEIERHQVHDWLARAEVRDQLKAMGVDPKAAQARVDSMTPEEVHTMAANMNTMPAGGGFVEVAVLVVLILILLDLTGVTDIFPNI